MKAYVTVAACAALLAACSPPKKAEPVTAVAAAAKFNTDLTMEEFMGHVVDPAAFAYWAGSGTEETAKGVRDLSPTTDEGWEKLENAAAIVAEAGNLMQLPGRERRLPGVPDSDWYKHAQDLTRVAMIAKAAAEKHDKDAVFKAGADLYSECTACHEKYVIQPQLQANGRPQAAPLPNWPADVKAKQESYAGKH